jgi:NADPH:quinone reductase-like Zn-dependent oxidoreductase
MMRTGKPYLARLVLGLTKPKKPIPGTGFAGVIEQVGKDVKAFSAGDRVFGETTTNFSANAEYLTVAETGVIQKMPEKLDYSEAAAFCDGHLTSYNFLKEKGRVTKGQKVLINGASGSLGTSAVQIAKFLGAEVTAVCSGKNAGLVRSLGADHVIDYTRMDFTKGRPTYDLIYDTVGKSSFQACKQILKKYGLYLSPVLSMDLLVQMAITSIGGNRKARFEATGMLRDEKLNSMLQDLIQIFNQGKLKTVIDRQFPLERLADAHEYIDKGHKKGNVIILND